MDTVRKPVHLVRIGDVVLKHTRLLCVLETLGSWDGGIMLRVFDLDTGSLSNEFFTAFDELNVLV